MIYMTTPWAGRWRQARPYDSGLISHACILLLRSLVANKILKLKDLLMLPDITKILTYLNAGSALLVLTMSVQAFYTVHGHTYILTHAHTPTHRCGR